jgi:hypothetical protein
MNGRRRDLHEPSWRSIGHRFISMVEHIHGGLTQVIKGGCNRYALKMD